MSYKIQGIEIDGIGEPVLSDGTTFVPLANVAQALGGFAEFDNDTKVAKVDISGHSVFVQADNPVVQINGNPTELQASPYIESDTMYVPVRLFEKMGFNLAVSGNEISLG